MIIEIKNLPQGRNIKKITFDIEFEDGTPTEVKVQEPISINQSKDSEISTQSSTVINSDREYKEIPPEMTDLEF